MKIRIKLETDSNNSPINYNVELEVSDNAPEGAIAIQIIDPYNNDKRKVSVNGEELLEAIASLVRLNRRN